MSNISSEQWDKCKTDNDKLRFLNDFIPSKVSGATKFWIRDWMRKSDWKSEDIQDVLGNDWK